MILPDLYRRSGVDFVGQANVATHYGEISLSEQSGRVPHLRRSGSPSIDTQPFRAGLTFGDGPPGLDELSGRTFYGFRLSRHGARRRDR